MPDQEEHSRKQAECMGTDGLGADEEQGHPSGSDDHS